MITSARIAKQTIILFVFILLVSGISYGGYVAFRQETPTPTPNPTINLFPIAVVSHKLVNIDNNDYDFWAKVNNPNTNFGSPNVEYELLFFGSADNQIGRKLDSFYILPGQTKFIINSPFKFSEPVARAEIAIKSINWQEMDPLSQENISFLARNFAYNEVSTPGVFSKVGGQILNDSNFDFNQVGIIVLLFDETNTPIAIGKTEILTFLAKTTRGFETSWYVPFVGKVSRVEVETYTNIFENSNFIRQYGRPEKFQQFY